MSFKRASRKAAVLRAALCGTAGSGKTYSSLLLALGIAGQDGKIAVIDTERGSASLYSDLCSFDTAELEPPYTPRRYIDLIREAGKTYDVLIIDSLTHAWAGQGGVLDMHSDKTRVDRSVNSYTAWRDVTPEHNLLVDTILGCPCHVIATMRSKTAYELQQNDRGKMVPVKIGLQPIQRDGLEYEFTLVWDVISNGNIATASKDRTRLWHNRSEMISKEHGVELSKWLLSGEQIDTEEVRKTLAEKTDEQIREYWRKLGVTAGHAQYKEVVAMFTERKTALKGEQNEQSQD